MHEPLSFLIFIDHLDWDLATDAMKHQKYTRASIGLAKAQLSFKGVLVETSVRQDRKVQSVPKIVIQGHASWIFSPRSEPITAHIHTLSQAGSRDFYPTAAQQQELRSLHGLHFHFRQFPFSRRIEALDVD
jgi:hypothetical protein